MIELRVHDRIRDIGETAWDSLLGPDGPPFLRFAWLDALERAGCVTPEHGWLPQHLALYQAGEIVALSPAYVKVHSEGEFVFDHGWANLAHRLGIDYFPKLILAVPFTPATGPRILVSDESERDKYIALLSQGIRRILSANEVSSAHVLFPPEDEALGWQDAGFFERHGVQFQWQNQGYESFEHFLGSFNSKRRNQIRRERRGAHAHGLAFQVCTGSDITDEVLDAMYRFYLATVDKFVWGRRYLNREFFEDVCTRMPHHIEIVIARDGQKRIVAGAFNLKGGGVLYGRYWGADEELPYLHFETCYYQGIESAIEQKLVRFEPGAGGEHKIARGFLPTITRSSHLLMNPRFSAIVEEHVKRERAHIARIVEEG